MGYNSGQWKYWRIFNFIRNYQIAFKNGFTNFSLLSAMYESSSSPYLCQYLVLLVFNFSFSGEYKVISHYGFDLHFYGD